MSDLDALLDVQALDLKVDQLHHRREHLEERTELVDLGRRTAQLEASRAEIEATVVDQAQSQRRLEGEVAAVEARRVEVDGTMYSGSITSPKELQALQDEIGALDQRQNMLEDQVLEIMEQLETLRGELTHIESDEGATAEQATAATEAIKAHEGAIESEIAAAQAERAATSSALPDELLAEYERLRSGFAGIAVARLEGGRCLGCNLALSAVELDRIKSGPSDAKVYCEECGRLLVH